MTLLSIATAFWDFWEFLMILPHCHTIVQKYNLVENPSTWLKNSWLLNVKWRKHETPWNIILMSRYERRGEMQVVWPTVLYPKPPNGIREAEIMEYFYNHLSSGYCLQRQSSRVWEIRERRKECSHPNRAGIVEQNGSYLKRSLI